MINPIRKILGDTYSKNSLGHQYKCNRCGVITTHAFNTKIQLSGPVSWDRKHYAVVKMCAQCKDKEERG